MGKIVYIVICGCNNGDEMYHIDTVWTSQRKAEKRRDYLNNLGFDKLQEYGYGFFDVACELLEK